MVASVKYGFLYIYIDIYMYINVIIRVYICAVTQIIRFMALGRTQTTRHKLESMEHLRPDVKNISDIFTHSPPFSI